MAGRHFVGFLGVLSLVLVGGCTREMHETTRTYTDPSLATRTVSAIALFPVRDALIAESQSVDMNRRLVDALQRKNPKVRVIEPRDVIAILNGKHLVDDYDHYLVELGQTGIPNRDILGRIGEALGVDAIMQGRLVGLQQADGSGMSGVPGLTALTLRYSIVCTRDAVLLWETSEEVRKQRSSNFSAAPRLRGVLPEAVANIAATIPAFAAAPAQPTGPGTSGSGRS
jgi:hypothetical protein